MKLEAWGEVELHSAASPTRSSALQEGCREAGRALTWDRFG